MNTTNRHFVEMGPEFLNGEFEELKNRVEFLNNTVKEEMDKRGLSPDGLPAALLRLFRSINIEMHLFLGGVLSKNTKDAAARVEAIEKLVKEFMAGLASLDKKNLKVM